MAWKPRRKKCGYESSKRKPHWFRAMFKEAKYCSKRCRNAAGQQRLRERARMYEEHRAELHGAIGSAAQGD